MKNNYKITLVKKNNQENNLIKNDLFINQNGNPPLNPLPNPPPNPPCPGLFKGLLNGLLFLFYNGFKSLGPPINIGWFYYGY